MTSYVASLLGAGMGSACFVVLTGRAPTPLMWFAAFFPGFAAAAVGGPVVHAWLLDYLKAWEWTQGLTWQGSMAVSFVIGLVGTTATRAIILAGDKWIPEKLASWLGTRPSSPGPRPKPDSDIQPVGGGK